MSIEYTAEDFAKASFARHPDLGLATRDGGVDGSTWVDTYGDECDDSGMALYDWTPVVEIEDWKQRIDDLRATHDDVKSFLKDTADDLRARVDEREATIRDLRHDLALAQESYYAEQVAEFERGIARIKAEALREALSKVDEALDARLPGGGLRIGLERAGNIISRMTAQIEGEAGL